MSAPSDISFTGPEARVLSEIDVGLIYPSHTSRPIDAKKVAEIAASIQAVGLLNPICVRPCVRHKGTTPFEAFNIVAGHHRYDAVCSLKRETITCIVIELDDLHAELAEIDENLMRAELSPAQEASAIFRRKAIYEELYPETKHGTNQHSRGDCNLQTPSFVEATATATGKDASTVSRANARAKALGDDLKAVEGTSLDKGVELDALAKMVAEERKGIIERAVAGEVVSARTPRPEPNVNQAPELGLQAPDSRATAAEPETNSPLTPDEWRMLGEFFRRIVADYRAEWIAGGEYSPDYVNLIKRFDEIHGAGIFAREAFESRLSYWAFDLWEYKFRAFEKAEAKAARRKGRSR